MALGEFHKYEALGNDFVVVDAPPADAVDSALARRVCDRHFGVGADGVLSVLPPVSAEARARLVVLNADGTRPEMCGNGLRCVALHLALHDGAAAISYVIDTDAGPLLAEVDRDGDAARVGVAMGRGAATGEHVAELSGRAHRFSRISVGNPHAVLFGAGLDEADIDALAPRVSAALSGGSNVEFAMQREPRLFDLTVWERGVGRTLACGTGAAATAVAAALSERAPFDEPITLRLPGGALEVVVERGTLAVHVRGPARRVFRGELAGV
jgi:diaminopimelate epimerase